MKLKLLSFCIAAMLTSCLRFDPDYAVDADSGLYIRSGPGIGYPTLTLLPNGTDISVLDWNANGVPETLYGKTGNWIKVRSSNIEGWTFAPFVVLRSGIFHFIYRNFLGLAFYFVALVLVVKLTRSYFRKQRIRAHDEHTRIAGERRKKLAAEQAEIAGQLREQKQAERLAALTAKFGETDALRIIDCELWMGMTQEMILESWGSPDHTELNIKPEIRIEYWYFGAFQNNRGNTKYKNLLTVKNGVLEGYQDL